MMKKKILIVALTFCMFIWGISGALAEEVTFSDIKQRYTELINDDDYTITDEENRISVFLTNPTYGEYSISFDYNDNVISYVNNRDLTAANDETKYYYASTDFYFISAMLYTLFDVYDIKEEAMNGVEINYDEMGFSVVNGEEINYETDDGVKASFSSFESLNIDLTKFDNYTKDYQGGNKNLDNTLLLIKSFKSIINPMTTNVFSFDFESGDNLASDIIDDNNASNEEEIKQNENTKTSQVVNVPATGINSVYVLVGFVIGAFMIGGLTYIMIKSKK